MSFWIEKPIFLELSMLRKTRTSSAKGKLFSFLLIFHIEACKWTYKWKQANLLIFILKYVSSSDKVFSQISFFFLLPSIRILILKKCFTSQIITDWFGTLIAFFQLMVHQCWIYIYPIIQNIHKNSYKLKYLRFWISKLNFAYR